MLFPRVDETSEVVGGELGALGQGGEEAAEGMRWWTRLLKGAGGEKVSGDVYRKFCSELLKLLLLLLGYISLLCSSYPLQQPAQAQAHLKHPFDSIPPPLVPHPPHHWIRHVIINCCQFDIERPQRKVSWTRRGGVEVRRVDGVRVEFAHEVGGVR